MAIGKWIPFASSQSPAASPAPVVVDQPPVASAADAKCFGLENFGNTCYANSVLQALYFCGPFRDLLLQYPDPSVPDVPPLPVPAPTPTPAHAPPPPPPTPQASRKKPGRSHSVSESAPTHANAHAHARAPLPPAPPIPPAPPTLFSALRSLYLHISRHPADKGTVAPRALVEKIKELNELFRGSMHQDAHEFLNFLLNRIMEEMEDDRRRVGNGHGHGQGHGNTTGNTNGNGAAPSGEDLSNSLATLASSAPGGASYHSTLVHRLFEGVLTSETRCLTCETVSARDESFLDLSIDIEQNSSVTACLRQFSASEMLCQKNKFFCDSCCDLQEAEKRMKIKKLPNVLALHLKRFKYQEDVQKYIKLTYRVAFPLQLRLFNTVDDAEDPDRLYELFAIVVHIGTGPHHGHYVTIIKARGVWMLFDDDTVSPIKESDIPKYFGDSNSGSAYVLYYQAVDLDLVALGLKPPTPPPASTPPTDSSKPLSVTTEPSEPTPGSPAPAMPPGLTEEPDSDKSDSPMPSTPATHPTPLSPPHTPKLAAAAAPPNLVVSIPSPPGASSPASTLPPLPASPSQPQHNHSLGGLFHSLRQSPSLRLRSNGFTGASVDSRRSSHDPLPLPHSPAGRRPRTAQSAASTATTAETSQHTTTHEGAPSVPPSPVPSKAHVLTNGTSASTSSKEKERGPEKKSSAWFKRKSSRHDPASASTSSKDKDKDKDREDSWFHHAHARLGRRGSEAAIASSLPASPLLPTAFPSLAAVASDPPPLHAAHKKSSPELARTAKRERRGAPPVRPSTAGARIGSSEFDAGRPRSGVMMPPPPPPLPPLPGSPTSPVANGAAESVLGTRKERERENGDPSRSRPHSPGPKDPGTSTPHDDPHPPPVAPQPQPSHPQPTATSTPTPPPPAAGYPFTASPHGSGNLGLGLGLGIGYGGSGGSVADTPVVPPSGGGSGSSSTSSGSGAGANWKRATRKLSFTAPMLGLGRKDRERHSNKERGREREKEKTAHAPPSAFSR
ncbi:hypothetical protein C8Q78DRAFT_1076965 [Trametes maxima]|nr:hypothetical protein C8Q78DRAFT_1076965 [Trametes maxima]